MVPLSDMEGDANQVETRIGWKQSKGSFSSMLPKSFNEQIMVQSAEEGRRNESLHDETMVRVGGRVYAPIAVSVPPKTNPSPFFNNLFFNLSSTGIGQKPLPYSIAITMESDGISGMAFKQALSRILAIASAKNKLILAKNTALLDYNTIHQGKVVKLKISAMTWKDCDTAEDIRQLVVQKMRLWRGIEAWGAAQAVENNGDTVEAWASSCLGLTYKNIGAACPMPFMSAAKLLPLTRPSSPFPRGNILYKSLDGKILPYNLFDPSQNSWVTMFSGNMGSGKSVTLSSRVMELVFHSLVQTGKLPLALIGDIGETSKGCAMNLIERLPPEIRYQVSYRRLQNSREDSINPLDTAYSFRIPHARDKLFMQVFVTALVTPAERNGKPEEEMSSYVGAVIDAAFKLYSDKNSKGIPQQYRPGLVKEVDDKLKVIGVDLKEGESVDCWKLFDLFHEQRMYREAELIQRYAVPTLNDLVAAAQQSEITENFGTKQINNEPIFKVFQRGIASAIKEFPAFSTRTTFDAGVARMLFLDLNDVAPKGQSPQVRKQSGLFYQMARQLFIKKTGFSDKDLEDLIAPEYMEYYESLVNELVTIPKGMFFDEVHRATKIDGFMESLEGDGRESRKWMLMIDLYSQDMRDYGSMVNFATGYVFMEKGSEDSRQWAKEHIGLSDVDIATMVRFCNGAGPGGAPYLAKFKMENRECTAIMVSKIGPKLMWSLSSNANDRSLRNILIKQFGRARAIEILAAEFKGGNCKKALDELSNKESSEAEVGTLVEQIAKRIIAKYHF